MKQLLAIITLLSSISWGQEAHQGDKPAHHGMLLFGDKHHYVSHLPMFHNPHNYQGLFEVQLEDTENTLEKYQASKALGAKQFTIFPEKMDLTQLINGNIKEFQAMLYEGHFERGGKPLGNINLIVKNIIFAKTLNTSSTAHIVPHFQESYIVFGKDNEYFAIHDINARPDFDAIIKVTKPIKFIKCGRRDCPIEKPILDSELPFTLIQNVRTSGKFPKVDSVLGILNQPRSQIIEVQYLETDDLSH